MRTAPSNLAVGMHAGAAGRQNGGQPRTVQLAGIPRGAVGPASCRLFFEWWHWFSVQLSQGCDGSGLAGNPEA